jgi:hypothetical protein
VLGFLLIATGQLLLGAVGIGLFVLAFLVPFLRLPAARVSEAGSTPKAALSPSTLKEPRSQRVAGSESSASAPDDAPMAPPR